MDSSCSAATPAPAPGPDDRAVAAIAALAGSLGPADALVIFPGGDTFTERRRLRSIERLDERDEREQATLARAMRPLPFNGDHTAGVQALSTRQFPNDQRPLRKSSPDRRAVEGEERSSPSTGCGRSRQTRQIDPEKA